MTPDDTRPNCLVCTTCGRILYVDILGEGIDEDEANIKWAAHMERRLGGER